MSADLFRQAEEQLKSEKRAAWERLQLESPDTAEVIADVSAVFGRPEAVEIQFGDETFRQGRFRGAMDYQDWRDIVDVERKKYLRGKK